MAYKYDPFGRLDNVTSAGQVVEDYGYDGFDRIGEHRKLVSGALVSTKYAYDPLDRTTSRTEKAGTPAAKTTDFAYLGLTDQLLDERVGGTLTKTYQYGAGGQRVSQTTVAADRSKTDGFNGYNAHTDVGARQPAPGTSMFHPDRPRSGSRREVADAVLQCKAPAR